MISGNTQCYHHVPLIILVVIAGTDKERLGCSKIQLQHGPPSIQMGVTAGIFLASILLKEMRYLVSSLRNADCVSLPRDCVSSRGSETRSALRRLSSKWCKPENERKSHSNMHDDDTCHIVHFETDCRLFIGLHHLRVSNHLKEHIILYNPIEYRAWNSYI